MVRFTAAAMMCLVFLSVLSAACVEGSHQCDSGNIYFIDTCINGQWVANSECPHTDTCQNGACVASLIPPACTDGDHRCDPNNMWFVDTCQNGQWVANSECPHTWTCQSGACIAPPQPCTDGDHRCDPNNQWFVDTCMNGQWVANSECPHTWTCQSGTCVDTSCSEGQVHCPDAQTVQTCNGGMWATGSCAPGRTCQEGTGCVENPTSGSTSGGSGSSSGFSGGSGSGGGGTGGGQKPQPPPCVGYTPPQVESKNTVTQTQGSQSRDCTTSNTVSYCKLATGQTDTSRPQRASTIDCTAWKSVQAQQVQAPINAPAPTPAPVAATGDEKPADNGWMGLLSQYGIYLAIPVGIVLAVGLFMVLTRRKES